MRNVLPVAACIATLTIASGANAASIVFSDLNSSWSNPVGGSNLTNVSGSGPIDRSEIRWGGSTGDKSGYIFEAAGETVSGGVGVGGVGDAFTLGTFTHINFPIPVNTSISSVDLKITGNIGLDADDDGIVDQVIGTGLDFDFSFLHNETPNGSGTGNPCVEPVFDLTPCGDLVNINIVQSTDTFIYDNIEYTLEIFGFIRDGQFETTFFSDEGAENEGFLQARFSSKAVPGVVPLPAGLPLVLTGLGALGLAARRRRG